MPILDGFKFVYKNLAKGRIVTLKEDAWRRNGAEIVDDPESATHIIVGQWKDKLESSLPIVKDSWPSDCIETGRLLDIKDYLFGQKRPLEQTTPSQPDSPSKRIRASRQEAFSFDSSMVESFPNQAIIDFFHELANQRSASGKEFSKRAYDRAILAIEDIPFKITSVDQAVTLLPSVFKGRIKQGLETILEGKLSPEVMKRIREKSAVLAKFQAAIYGVGAKRARDFYNSGCRTLADVRKITKDPGMIASIDHSEDLLQRISRDEVTRHYEYVAKVVKELDSDSETMCMGSYRRQKADCGDIDVLITKKGASRGYIIDLAQKTVKKLFDRKFAVYTFGGGTNSTKWLGATVLPDVECWRRMDILAVKYDELGAAMCYYTGSDMFNRCMRFRAQKIGMQLNETGLFQRDTDIRLASKTEEEIFEKLGIEWREPKDRDVSKFALIDDQRATR